MIIALIQKYWTECRAPQYRPKAGAMYSSACSASGREFHHGRYHRCPDYGTPCGSVAYPVIMVVWIIKSSYAFCGNCVLCHWHHWLLFTRHIICCGHRQNEKCISYRFWSVCCRMGPASLRAADSVTSRTEFMQVRVSTGLSDFSKIFAIWYRMFWSMIIVNATLFMASAILDRGRIILFSVWVLPHLRLPGEIWWNWQEIPKSSRLSMNWLPALARAFVDRGSPSIWLEDCVMRLTWKIYDDRSRWVWNKEEQEGHWMLKIESIFYTKRVSRRAR